VSETAYKPYPGEITLGDRYRCNATGRLYEVTGWDEEHELAGGVLAVAFLNLAVAGAGYYRATVEIERMAEWFTKDGGAK
jgi:hypothetical protein